MTTQYETNRARHLCVPGGSVRLIGPPAPVCTVEDRRAIVGCYLVEEDGTVWCIYDRCVHGYAEVTTLYSPLLEQTETDANQAPVSHEV